MFLLFSCFSRSCFQYLHHIDSVDVSFNKRVVGVGLSRWRVGAKVHVFATDINVNNGEHEVTVTERTCERLPPGLAPKCLAPRCVPNKPVECVRTLLIAPALRNGGAHWRRLESSDDCVRGQHGTFFVSFNGEVQCTIDYSGYKPNNEWSVLKHLRTHEHGECSDPWYEL